MHLVHSRIPTFKKMELCSSSDRRFEQYHDAGSVVFESDIVDFVVVLILPGSYENDNRRGGRLRKVSI